MKFSKKTWLVISGGLWMAIGAMLLVKGLRFIVSIAERNEDAAPLLGWIAPLVGSRHQAALLLISAGLFVGFIKGRTLLAKSVQRIVSRISTGSESLAMNEVYDTKYYVILAVMVGIGMVFRFLPIPLDIRGVIDVAIGSALINGAMLYFRESVKRTV